MAPLQAPLTPEQDAYAPLKTPDDRRETTASASTFAARYRIAGRLAQLLVLASVALYVFGQVLVLTPLYNNKMSATISGWWGVPKSQPKGGAKGHAEMTRPTYFMLFAVLPLLVSGVLVEFLRHFNVRRLSSAFLLRIALVLRRKPALFGTVSHWSLGEMLFFCALVLGNVFVFVRYYISRVQKKQPDTFEKYLECVGLTLGFTCLFNLAFLFLPATRNSAWMEFFNISYANSIKYHRWVGVSTTLAACAHLVCYYWSWLRQGEWVEQAMPCFNCNFGAAKSVKRWEYFFGQLAFLIFILMGVTALPFVRRQFYNVFYYTHQLLFVAIIFIALHWQYTVWWMLPTLVLFLLSRVSSSVNGFSPVQVTEVTALSEKLVKVVFKREEGHQGRYKVGQFLYLNVPAVSKLQWHAFTVASSPRSSPTTVTVLLKSLGDWTGELVTHANECKQKNIIPTIYVDGFYGASLEMYDEYSTLCLVAGGIGVTPILSMLHDIVARLSHHEPLEQKIVFIFAFRELALFEELAPVLAQLRELDPQQQHVTFHLTLTGLTSDDELDVQLASSTTAAKTTEPVASHKPFAQPLRSSAFKSLAYVAVFAAAIFLIVYAEYGSKIKRRSAKLWALQQFAELFAVVGGVVVAALAIIVIERAIGGGNPKTYTHADAKPLGGQDWSLQISTYRELLAEFGVVIGDQPNILTLLQQTHARHSVAGSGAAEKTSIGVFASGPETIKRAVELAIAQIDVRAFDLRQEQFEL